MAGQQRFNVSKNLSEKQKKQKMTESLCRKTHFSKSQIEALINEYESKSSKSGSPQGEQIFKMDRTKFRDILHGDFGFTDDMVMDRIFKAFDQDNDGNISKEEWVKGMSCFLLGEQDERMKFCFEVYNLNGDGYIKREEMFQMLKTSLVRQANDEDPDEGVKELVEMALKKLDRDGDQKVSYQDFTDSVDEDFLCLEYFGGCIPRTELCKNYLKQFEE